MRNVAVMLLAVFFLPQVTGCIIIPPLPLPPLGAQIGREDIETLEPGLVKREQVHEVLGSPHTTVTDRYEIFDVGEERFNVFWMVFGGGGGGGDLVRIGRRSYRVLAEYGTDDVLRDLRWEGTDEVPSEEEEPLPSATWPDVVPFLESASPDGHLLLAIRGQYHIFGSPTFTFRLHDGWTGAPIAKVEAIPGCKFPWIAKDNTMTSPAPVFLSDSKHLAIISGRDTLCIWNADTGRGVFELFAGEELVGLSAAHSAPIVAADDASRKITIWNGLTGAEVNTIAPCSPESSCRYLRMALSDDGRLLATLQDNWARPKGHWGFERVRYGVRLWDVESGAELAAIELINTPDLDLARHNIAVSSDPERVAVHLGDHIGIWRFNETAAPPWQEGKDIAPTTPWAAELESVLFMPPIGDQVYPSIAFSADGRKLAAGDSFAIVWEAGTWREIWRAPSIDGLRYVFTADGRRIITSRFSWDVPELDESRRSAAPPS